MGLGVITGTVVQASDVSLLARIRGAAGALITQASLSAIAWQVSDLTAGVVLGSGTFAVATSVFDSLVQNDPRWTMDSQQQPGADGAFGYNFAATIAASNFPPSTLTAPAMPPATPHRLQADVHFTDAGGGNWRVVWAWTPVVVYA